MRIETPAQLRRAIGKLEAPTPITDQFDARLRALGQRGDSSSDRTQKAHWLAWLDDYDGPGFYGRKRWDRSAGFIYTHVVCPPMVLWLGEASGLGKPSIRTAAREALRAPASLSSRCAAIRRIIPWDEIHQALTRA